MSDAPFSVIVTTREELREVVRDAVRESASLRSEVSDVLTLDQAAELLQCSAATVKKHVKKLGLPAFSLGDREWRFRRSSILTWLDTRKKGTR